MAHQNSNFFDEPDSCRTLALEAEGRTFWVSRETLAVYSPVFKAMLYGNFVEANKDRIQLPNKKAVDIEEVLCCWIPTLDKLKPIDDANMELILNFADEYQIDILRDRVESFLMSKMIECSQSDKALLDILRIASERRLRTLLVPTLKRCAQEFELNDLRLVFDNLKTEVVAALVIYKFTPKNPRCQYEVKYDQYDHCGIETDFRKCKHCAFQYCYRCSCAVPLPCLSQVKAFEDIARALLDKM